jgi:archaeal cell division control protein 6
MQLSSKVPKETGVLGVAAEKLNNFFEEFLKNGSIFLDKKVLQAAHRPLTITHRDEQIQEMAAILAPTLKNERPSNLFVYGNTGTGKTLVAKHITSSMEEIAKKNNTPLKIIHVNCKLRKVADTEYRLIAHLAREFGKAIPPTGLPTDQVYTIFYEALDHTEQVVLLVLDEIDQLAKRAGDDILYNLTRINAELKKAQIAMIGISNDLVFIDHLDARVRSSLAEEELLFPPYNALQIQDILRERSKKAFKENALKPAVIEKCAAYAAREHGDARRALELLRVAAELAERKGCQYVEIKHLDEAEEKIERDRLLDTTLNQPKQFQLVLYATLILASKRNSVFTGEIYGVYENVCKQAKIRPLTQRRVSDIIAELDMFGIIQAKVISKGRYGRTRDISIAIPQTTIPRIKELLVRALDLS